jgi:hypothetical protein
MQFFQHFSTIKPGHMWIKSNSLPKFFNYFLYQYATVYFYIISVCYGKYFYR